jgi:DNA polymerase (family X)
MINQDIITAFKKAAAVLEIIDTAPYRLRAYQKAIETMESLDQELSVMVKTEDITKLSGIGAELAQKIKDLITSGHSQELDELYKKVPAGMFAILNLEGIGPKKAYQLASRYQLDAINAHQILLSKALAGEIQDLPGWGKKSESLLINSLTNLTEKESRLPIDQAELLASRVINFISTNCKVVQIEPMGSLRRRQETIGDIDIGLVAGKSNYVAEKLESWVEVKKVTASGQNLIRLLVVGGRQVDIKLSSKKSWGSTLQHFTGSKQHNIKLREFALKQGKSLSEHGIKHNNKLHFFSSELEFYHYLKLDWIPPELRHGEDEIILAKKHRLPKLVSLRDIKGDTHTHTNFKMVTSHDSGEDPIALINQADKLGYQWLCLGDHNPAKSKYNDHEIVDLIKQRNFWIIQKYQACKNSENIEHIYTSLEIDIDKTGNLATSNRALKNIDIVIASIHSQFNLSLDMQTSRLLKAIQNPHVKIIGHPGGRLIGTRSLIQVNWDLIFKACKKFEVALEINASPKRLDLPDSLVKVAIKCGVKLSIGSDAHLQANMVNLKYGVDTARRGGAQKRDIINAYTVKQLSAWLKRKGG